VIASEQQRPDVQLQRERFFEETLKDVPLQKIVVLDETYATTTFTRLRGRCSRSSRLKASVPNGHWKRLTILGAITINGVLCASSIDAATDADVFLTFINDVLVPHLSPGMVVVMDNLSSHNVRGVDEAITQAGCRLVYLPPYSPDYSPIENIQSKLKQRLRSLAARSVESLQSAITTALASITASDCLNSFLACGYRYG
jgi:transposase